MKDFRKQLLRQLMPVGPANSFFVDNFSYQHFDNFSYQHLITDLSELLYGSFRFNCRECGGSGRSSLLATRLGVFWANHSDWVAISRWQTEMDKSQIPDRQLSRELTNGIGLLVQSAIYNLLLVNSAWSIIKLVIVDY